MGGWKGKGVKGHEFTDWLWEEEGIDEGVYIMSEGCGEVGGEERTKLCIVN